MALHVPRPPGIAQMMKEGSRHYQGLEEAVYRNIEACVALTQTTRSTYGPSGQNKIVINHIGKQFVTNDAVTILRELEVAHPAAKMLVLATQQQEQEAGDGTNFVFLFAGSLLEKAGDLLRMGLSASQVTEGYELASKKALELLDQLVVGKATDLRNAGEVMKPIKSSVMSKQFGMETFLSELITRACITTLPEKSFFNVDNVRVLKVLGSGVLSSSLVQGMVFKRDADTDVKEAHDCKVVVYSCPLDTLQTETKGTVLIHTAAELKDFSKGDEALMEQHIRLVAEMGTKVIVTGGKVGELALHYANKYGLMVVRLTSKFDLRRLCQTIGATALPRLTAPTAEELGHVDHVKSDEIGETNVVIFQQLRQEGVIATIVLRGSTENIMDDIERAVDDGVNTYKCLTKDPRLLAGAGATEIELARLLLDHADKTPGLEQYAMREFAHSFEIVVKALAENSGLKATEVIAQLYANHQSGQIRTGLVTEGHDVTVVKDAVEGGVIDLWHVKHWAIRFATVAACTVLRVDQIIMARPSGGPKPRDPKAVDADDD